MSDDNLLQAVRAELFEYVKSPSLTHIRDPYALGKLAQRIVGRVSGGNPIWRKWDAQRETLLRSAALCWIPTQALRDFLNLMDGPVLTSTDVAQRLRAFHEEDYADYPDERLQAPCVALFEAEQAQGTELPAIIGAVQDLVERERQRLHDEQQAAWRQSREDERIALEQRFLSGADCKWTPVNRSAQLYCRISAHTYRLTPTKDRGWTLEAISALEDEQGELIGTYRTRGHVTKALSEVSRNPQARR